MKTQMTACYLKGLRGSGWALMFCISSKFPGAAAAADPGGTLGKPLFQDDFERTPTHHVALFPTCGSFFLALLRLLRGRGYTAAAAGTLETVCIGSAPSGREQPHRPRLASGEIQLLCLHWRSLRAALS